MSQPFVADPASDKLNDLNGLLSAYDPALTVRLLDALRPPELRTLCLHLPGGILEFVDAHDISYLRAEGPITHVSLRDGNQFKAMRNLGKYEQVLTRNKQFFRIHDKMVVNLDVVRRYNHAERCLTLRDGTVLYASKLRGEALRAHFLRAEE